MRRILGKCIPREPVQHRKFTIYDFFKDINILQSTEKGLYKLLILAKGPWLAIHDRYMYIFNIFLKISLNNLWEIDDAKSYYWSKHRFWWLKKKIVDIFI